MKFICENCKAKYQIGDDKIAGRSVRMKCRRCGHLIQLSASVTESSASSGGDGLPAELVDSFVETGSSTSIPIGALLGPGPTQDPFDEDSTSIFEGSLSASGAMPAAPPRAGAGASALVAPPRAGAGPSAPAAPRVGTGVSGAMPAVTRAGLGAGGAPAALRPIGTGGSAISPSRAGSPLGAAPTPVPTRAGLGAPAGSALGARPPAAPVTPTPTPARVPHGEDWYVGVGGVPLGPVRLAVIREKALTGAVQPESLVWREGFDEWQPLKNFPELLEIVEEAQAARAPARAPSAAAPRAPSPGAPAASAPKPVAAAAATALSPLGPKSPSAPTAAAAAPFQPRATAIGMGMPAVTLPAKAPLGASAPVSMPLGDRPTAPSGVLPSTAPSGPSASKPLAARPAPSGVSATLPSAGIPGILPAERPSSLSVLSPRAGLPSSPSALSAPSAPRATPLAEPTRPSAPLVRPGEPNRTSVPEPSAALPSTLPAPEVLLRTSSPDPLLAAASAPPAPLPTPPPTSAGTGTPIATLLSAPSPFAGAPLAAAPLPADPFAAASPAASGPALDIMRDPFATPPPAAASPDLVSTPPPTQVTGAPAPVVAPVVAPPSQAPDSLDEDRPRRRRAGMHPLAYALIAMAAAFGAVVAFLLFGRQPQQVVVVQAAPTQSGTTASPGVPSSANDAVPSGAPSSEVPTAEPSSSGPRVAGGPGVTGKIPDPKATASSGTSAPLDTSGFGNQVVPGPTATSTSTGADPSLGQLSAGEMQGVVASNQPRVRKRCWQPALDSSAAGSSKNARVQGRIVIGASGAVQSASASGAEKDFPGLSSCIAGQMKGWRFPPSSGSTTIDVPFVFAGQ